MVGALGVTARGQRAPRSDGGINREAKLSALMGAPLTFVGRGLAASDLSFSLLAGNFPFGTRLVLLRDALPLELELGIAGEPSGDLLGLSF